VAASAAARNGLRGLPLLLAVQHAGGVDVCLVTLSHSDGGGGGCDHAG
jgi:hypothetical protein